MKVYYAILFVGIMGLSSCSKSTQPSDPVPEHETFVLKSEKVGEDRVINVWLPDNYSATQDSLSVMYMADGGVQEDFPHIANTLSQLIAEKKIKPIILVGIENTERRRDLTGFTEVESDKKIAPVVGGSGNFRAFIKDELFPEIDKRYRTNSEKSLIGESASGLFVMETFFMNPEMFDNYIAFDPSLWWNNHYLTKTAQEHLAKFPTTEKTLWFAGSSAEDINPYTKQLAETLEQENLPNLRWKYSDEPNEKHQTIFRATKDKAIIWALNSTN